MRVWGGTVCLCLFVLVAHVPGAAAQDEGASAKRSRPAAHASTDERGFLHQLSDSQRTLGEQMQQLRDRIDGLYGELAQRKDDNAGVEQEVKELRDRIDGLYGDNWSVKQLIESLKEDVQSLDSNVSSFRTFSGFFIAAMLLLLSVIFLLTIRR